MSKQLWRYDAFRDNTKAIEDFCKKHNLEIKYMNNGYQLRINSVIDLYPVRKKWHYLKTNQRGDWEEIEDLDLDIFDPFAVRMSDFGPNDPMTNEVSPFEPKVAVPEIDTYRLNHINEPPKKRWWEFWK